MTCGTMEGIPDRPANVEKSGRDHPLITIAGVAPAKVEISPENRTESWLFRTSGISEWEFKI